MTLLEKLKQNPSTVRTLMLNDGNQIKGLISIIDDSIVKVIPEHYVKRYQSEKSAVKPNIEKLNNYYNNYKLSDIKDVKNN